MPFKARIQRRERTHCNKGSTKYCPRSPEWLGDFVKESYCSFRKILPWESWPDYIFHDFLYLIKIFLRNTGHLRDNLGNGWGSGYNIITEPHWGSIAILLWLEQAKDSMMLSKKVQHGLSYLTTCMSLRTVTIFSILTRKAESTKQCTSKSTSNIFLASLKLSRLLT